MNCISKLAVALCAAAPLAFVSTANAQSEGKFQAKLFATGVLANGEIIEINEDNFGIPPGSQTDVSDSYVPTIALEYFFTPNISVETICCITPHDVDGVGTLAGAQLVDNAIVLPATVTLKYHVNEIAGIKPYVGAGPTHFFIFDENVGDAAAGLGITDADLSDEFGFTLQAGFDAPINDSGWVFSIDAKRYFVNTTATFSNGNGVVFQTEHDIDPWVVSAGIGYRF